MFEQKSFKSKFKTAALCDGSAVTRDNMIEMDGAENVWTDVMQIAITDDRYTTNVVMQIHFTPVPVQ